MVPIEDLKHELREKVPLGIDIVLQSLKLVIPPDVPKYSDVILLEGRYRELNQNLIRGVLDNEEAQIEFNKLREAILNFINALETDDFALETAQQHAPAKAKKGKILYRIPDHMQVQKEVKCLIRIAFNEIILMTELEKSSDDLIKDIRIADVMSAEIIDPNENPAFTIRTFSEKVQFVNEEDFTEWLFYVKPLLEGTYPLLLKVAVVEIVDGLERKREVVLEEMVEVVAVKVPEEKKDFVEAAYELQTAGTIQPSNPKAPLIGGETKRKAGQVGAALLAVGVAMAILAYWFFTRQENKPDLDEGGRGRKAWNDIRNKPDSVALKDLLETYPNTEYTDSAQQLLESLRFSLEVMQQEDAIILKTSGGNSPMQLVLLQDSVVIVEQVFYNPDSIFVDGRAAGLADGTYKVKVTEALGAERIVSIEYKNQVDTTTLVENVPVINPPTPPVKPQKKPIKPKPKPNNKPNKLADKPVVNNNPLPDGSVTPNPPSEPVYAFQNVSRSPIYKSCNTNRLQKAQGGKLIKALAQARECTEREIRSFLQNQLSRTPEVLSNNTTKNLEVIFMIDKNGKALVESIKQDFGTDFKDKVKRVVESLPTFVPGQDALGNKVSVRYSIPIRFTARQ